MDEQPLGQIIPMPLKPTARSAASLQRKFKNELRERYLKLHQYATALAQPTAKTGDNPMNPNDPTES
jgi:hypothetical protein